MGRIVHPERKKLREFLAGQLGQPEMEIINRHLAGCEFCQEFCENYHLFKDSLEKVKNEEVPPSGRELADQLFRQAIRGSIVPLVPLSPTETRSGLLLAADGEQEQPPGPQNLTTLYADDPEMVLRVMRDPESGDYLQLISEDISLVSGVMVELPELGREFITDQSGHAILDDIPTDQYDKLKWQIRMPEAVFNLEPLTYDPERVQYSQETILESEHQDKIQVVFEGKTEGKQIILRVLELDGKPEFGSIKVVISQEKSTKSFATRPDETITFEIAEPGNAINIRIFQ